MEKDKNEVIKQAFAAACKFLRDHPPEDTVELGPEIVSLVIDAKSDPKGYRWAGYFIQQVLYGGSNGD